MNKGLHHKVIDYLDDRRIHVLLISILILVFIPPFLGKNPTMIDHFMKFDFLMIVLACYLIVRRIYTARFVGYLTFILIIIDSFFEHNILDYISQIGLAYLIIHAFILVLKEAMSLNSDAKNMILVSITGYLIIGLIGGFLAAGLAYLRPDSYYHSTDMSLDLYNYIYYSFVTMTTLGYGDIIPVTDHSQALALMLVLSGQLFLSVIIAINIAKFMQNKRKDQ